MLSWADSPYGIPALFSLALAESSFFPLPPDVLLIALTLGNPGNAWWYASVATVGSVVGGALGYGIGWYGGRPVLKKFMGQDRMDLVHQYFQRYEGWAILIAGFTPIPYKIFTIGAGAFYVDFKTFMVASIVSRGGRFFLVAGLIRLGGEDAAKHLRKYVDLIGWLVLALAVIVLLVIKFGGVVK